MGHRQRGAHCWEGVDGSGQRRGLDGVEPMMLGILEAEQEERAVRRWAERSSLELRVLRGGVWDVSLTCREEGLSRACTHAHTVTSAKASSALHKAKGFHLVERPSFQDHILSTLLE